jgi:predicted aspartyl protease
MKFALDDHLPLVTVQIEYNGIKRTFSNVLLDTGCSSTILDTDLSEKMG